MSHVDLLPPEADISANSVVFLNIPMDEETPTGRLLRPQAMVQERLLRIGGTTLAPPL